MAYSYMHNPEIWDIDRSHEVKRRTWWWYWWIFFFRNPGDPLRTKQLMVLWATRNAKKVWINGKEWRKNGDIVRSEGKASFPGMSAAWYYDGKRMYDPLFQERSDIVSRWDEKMGEVRTVENISSIFEYADDAYSLKIRGKGMNIDLKMEYWTSELSRAVRSGKQYLGNLGYKMYKIRGMKVSGTIAVGKNREYAEGTSYFQKVRINSPTSPWYWGVYHGPNGEYMDYFMPHIGMPIFRRGLKHKSIWDWGEKHLSNNLQYYDPDKKKYHTFEGVKVKREYEDDLPIFVLKRDNGNEIIKARIRTYSRAYWQIKQPWLGILSTVLVYNEYPAFVEEFEIKGRWGKITLDDIGNFVGNAEHAWGIV